MHIVLLGTLLCLGEKFILLLLPRKAGAAMSKLAQGTEPDKVAPCMKNTPNSGNTRTHRLTEVLPSLSYHSLHLRVMMWRVRPCMPRREGRTAVFDQNLIDPWNVKAFERE